MHCALISICEQIGLQLFLYRDGWLESFLVPPLSFFYFLPTKLCEFHVIFLIFYFNRCYTPKNFELPYIFFGQKLRRRIFVKKKDFLWLWSDGRGEKKKRNRALVYYLRQTAALFKKTPEKIVSSSSCPSVKVAAAPRAFCTLVFHQFSSEELAKLYRRVKGSRRNSILSSFIPFSFFF